ncbi:DNA recombination and repair protein RecO [hydrothermal vent metagenome]|uniref:DNA repair protein RecO n=1 Tax=hydrothermal vent metagenome TaxID=652676 RepID=A0A3B1BDB7_9ZZZZ
MLKPAFILHRKPHSNTSLLLECFTAADGRFPAIAKGVFAKRTGSSGLLQPFAPLAIKWVGRGAVKTLAVHEPNGSRIHLAGRALYCGFYINELVMRLLGRNDPHDELFHLYMETLGRLATSTDFEQPLRWFECLFLAELGYGMQLEHEAENGDPIELDRYYRYELEHGPLMAKPDAGNTIKGSTLLALAHDTVVDANGRKEARMLMRQVLAYYLGDRPLKSRELFQ